MIGVVVAAFVACAEPASSESAPHEEPSPFSIAAVPTATFDTDAGFGTGGVVTVYHLDGETKPYRDAVTANVFISSKLVQHHAISWDALRPFDIDGRAYLRVGYYSTVSQNYCGLGNDVTCAPGEAVAHATLLPGNVAAADRDDFVRHYYLMRFIRPYATVLARPWLRDKPWRTEVLVGWRGAVTIPGDIEARDPYPGSLYAQDHPDGEPGITSVPTLGVVVDDRDVETFPTKGTYVEASVRASSPYVGATRSWVGVDAQVREFLKLDKDVVLASRVIADVVVGDPTVEEMARTGGTSDTIAFGGSSIGRGIREQRYIGKLKAIGQAELRAQFFDTVVLEQKLNHGAAVFTDVAWIGKDISDVGRHPFKLLSTIGVSYRFRWNDNFSIRTDIAVSPDENDGPGFYVIVGNVF